MTRRAALEAIPEHWRVSDGIDLVKAVAIHLVVQRPNANVEYMRSSLAVLIAVCQSCENCVLFRPPVMLSLRFVVVAALIAAAAIPCDAQAAPAARRAAPANAAPAQAAPTVAARAYLLLDFASGTAIVAAIDG